MARPTRARALRILLRYEQISVAICHAVFGVRRWLASSSRSLSAAQLGPPYRPMPGTRGLEDNPRPQSSSSWAPQHRTRVQRKTNRLFVASSATLANTPRPNRLRFLHRRLLLLHHGRDISQQLLRVVDNPVLTGALHAADPL